MEVTVLVVDQNEEVCELLARRLDRVSGVRVIAHTTNVMLAAELVHQLDPDAIVADFTRDRAERTTKLGWLRRTSPTSALIVHSAYYSDGEREAFEAAGADLCLLKGIPVVELAAQIGHAVHARRHTRVRRIIARA
jgi:DNA-binding NarL/FixJ family response regulator